MRARDLGVLRPWLPAAALMVLAACHASAPRITAPAPAPDAVPPSDATYDWHVLVIVPFGVTLKDIPLTLHEVLLFRDEAHGTGAGDDAECYAPDGPAPRFLGTTPEEYLLCFKHDRLSRVQASVRLNDPVPAGAFAAACENWLRHAVPVAADAAASRAGVPTAGVPGAGVPGSGTCEGSDGAVRFSAHFDEEATLSIVLDGPPET
jgi:hypothetical protein